MRANEHPVVIDGVSKAVVVPHIVPHFEWARPWRRWKIYFHVERTSGGRTCWIMEQVYALTFRSAMFKSFGGSPFATNVTLDLAVPLSDLDHEYWSREGGSDH